ncbi:MAG: methyltransferase [Chloroflexota bacterium]
MKLGLIPQNPLELLAIWLRRVPTPMGESVFAMMLSRAIMAGVRLGLFDALEVEPLTTDELAARIRCSPSGVEALAEALTSSGYLVRRDGRLRNGPATSRWLVPSSPHYLGNLIRFNYDHWSWWSELEDHLVRGDPVEIHHRQQTEEELRRYVLAMRDMARLCAGEVADAIPLPREARRLLDVGGSHGAYSAALCRSHPGLRATVVDLEPVARIGRQLVAEEAMGERIAYLAADATRDPLGEGFDALLLFQLLHHFPPRGARLLLERVSAALRPGGLIALLEPASAGSQQLAGLLYLHYFLSSGGRVHRRRHIEAWLAEVGFYRVQSRRLHSGPGLELLTARRR